MAKDIRVLVNPNSQEVLSAINKKEKTVRFVIFENSVYMCDAYNTIHPLIMRKVFKRHDVYNVISGLLRHEDGKWKIISAYETSWIQGKARPHKKITNYSTIKLPHSFILS